MSFSQYLVAILLSQVGWNILLIFEMLSRGDEMGKMFCCRAWDIVTLILPWSAYFEGFKVKWFSVCFSAYHTRSTKGIGQLSFAPPSLLAAVWFEYLEKFGYCQKLDQSKHSWNWALITVGLTFQTRTLLTSFITMDTCADVYKTF